MKNKTKRRIKTSQNERQPKARNAHGGGSKTNENGLRFEGKTDLKQALLKKGFAVTSDNAVYSGKERIGMLAQKRSLYKDFLEPKGIDWKEKISKQMYPDDCFVNFKNKTAYVIEKKFQAGSGSVDEKLQTCDFKKKEYQKLFEELSYDVKYIYLLCDWFQSPKYQDVLDYIESVGCEYYFNEVPLDAFGLSDDSDSE